MAITAELIGKLGGSAPAGYGGIVSGTVAMPRSWATIPWPETLGALDSQGRFIGGGDYQIRAVLHKGSSIAGYNVVARILVNNAVVHTTDATNPGLLDHTLSLPANATVEIQAFTDSSTAAYRALNPGSLVVVMPV